MPTAPTPPNTHHASPVAGTPAPALGIPPAIWVCGAVLVGCALGATRHEAWLPVVGLGVVALILAALSRMAAAWTIAIVLLALGGALWRTAPLPPHRVQWPNTAVSEVHGITTAWPITNSGGSTVRVPVHIVSARTKTDWQATDATFMAILPDYPVIARGDAVFIIGAPRLEASAETDGTLYSRYARVERANTRHNGEDIAHMLMAGMRGRIEAAVRPPESGLIVGMLLGEKSALDPGTRSAMAATGTTHFIVIDGGSVAQMAGLIAVVGRAIGARRRSVWILVSLAGIMAYAFIMGADPPVIRAVTMGTIALLAPLLGRRADPLVSLGFAAAAMALWHPAIVTSLSFLISFSATFGVIALTPWVHRQMERVALERRFPHLTEMLAVSVAVYLATEPIIWHAFGQISPVSPVANVILEPLAPAIMALGAAASALTFLPIPLVAQAVGVVAAVPAWLFLRIVHLGAALPLAGMLAPQPGVAATLACYIVPTLVVFAMKAVREWRGNISRGVFGWGVSGFAVTLAAALVVLFWTT